MKKYISGNIRKIIFSSDNGPYKVGLFRVMDTNDEDATDYINKTIGFTGLFNEINEDVEYILYGKMIDHPKYGLQYSVDEYEIKVPNDNESLVLYLSSSMFKGIGKKVAKKIVDRFGNETIDIIKNDYEKLAFVSGMSMPKAKMMHDKILSSETNQDLIIKLNSLGFSVKESIDLTNKYQIKVLDIIDLNIYDLYGDVSFDKLDIMFLNNNDETDGRRIEAIIKHSLYNMCLQSGDTIIDKGDLFLRIKKYFKSSLSLDTYLVYLNKLINNNEIVLVYDKVSLKDFYDTEKNILFQITALNHIKSITSEKKIDTYISKYEDDYKIKFDIEQKNAIRGAIKNNFYIITGGPGSGKTTIIKAIVDIMMKMTKVSEGDIALLAPTGRSAKRMSESVGIGASTIHKFLKWNKETETFMVDEYNKAKEQIIIVDEASMIDIFLFNSLLKGIKYNVKLLLIGDANQLPSIGPGDVLNNLLNMQEINHTFLTKIYRVKNDSYINLFANDIKNKKYIDDFDIYSDFKFVESNDEKIKLYLEQVCNKIKEKKLSLLEFQVIAPMYKGINGIDELNYMMADIFNGENKKYKIGDNYYRVNDKVIQLVNDVENNVFNGDIGFIDSINNVDNKYEVIINFSGHKVLYKSGEYDKFSLAYAISVHKSQGSEYDNVVVILSSNFKRMFYNKLIYTAVTRAKSSLILIGNINSLNTSIQTLYADNRNTYLKNA